MLPYYDMQNNSVQAKYKLFPCSHFRRNNIPKYLFENPSHLQQKLLPNACNRPLRQGKPCSTVKKKKVKQRCYLSKQHTESTVTYFHLSPLLTTKITKRLIYLPATQRGTSVIPVDGRSKKLTLHYSGSQRVIA